MDLWAPRRRGARRARGAFIPHRSGDSATASNIALGAADSPERSPNRSTTLSAGRRRAVALLFCAVWFAVVIFLTRQHALWRDEVRALTQAVRGDSVAAMLVGIRSEGHPALWYLLLRAGHALFPRPEILPIVALTVASAAILLLALRSPFELPLIALLLASRFSIFEYSVMTRNYGISMLLMFVLAAVYERQRDRGCVLGTLLFLLANTNVHCTMLAAAFAFFWLVDTGIRDRGVRRAWALEVFVPNLLLAAAGIALCRLTIFSTFHDVESLYPHGLTPSALLSDIVFPATALQSLVPGGPLLGSLILFGSTLGLIRRPAAFAAAIAGLLGFSLFFNLVYPGDYRHAALWLIFLIVMYWIAGSAAPNSTRTSGVGAARPRSLVSTIGSYGLILLVALQVPAGLGAVANAASGGPPFSRSRDLGLLLANHPELRAATIIADPDYMVESLHYYLSNPTYLVREQRFGDTVAFYRKEQRDISLGDVLGTARRLNDRMHEPVVILLMQRLTASAVTSRFHESFYWTLTATPAQTRTFLSATKRIERFGPAQSDESYDVYVYDRLASARTRIPRRAQRNSMQRRPSEARTRTVGE